MGQIVGIDLGTTNSLVAAIIEGQPTLIPNERGKFITPSVVGFTESGELLVGEPAKNQAVANPERTIASIKRLMGTDRRISVGVKIKHYSNGSIIPDNPGIMIPATFSVGYAF